MGRKKTVVTVPNTRNPRVRAISQGEWQKKRIETFSGAVKFAAAAKAARTALGVTQGEVAEFYEIATGAVSNWESGKYFGWTREELVKFTNSCALIAEGRDNAEG